jgi:transposase-like protein
MTMITQTNNNTKCRCGRSLAQVHCPQCGRKWLVSVKRLDVVVVGNWTDRAGDKKRFPGYRCRSCGTEWNLFDVPPERCEAPPVEQLSVTQKRRLDTARENLNKALSNFGGDRKELLRRIVETNERLTHGDDGELDES